MGSGGMNRRSLGRPRRVHWEGVVPVHNTEWNCHSTSLLELYSIVLRRPSLSILPFSPLRPPQSNQVSEVYYFIELLDSFILWVYYEFNLFLWLRVGSGVAQERLLNSKYDIVFMLF